MGAVCGMGVATYGAFVQPITVTACDDDRRPMMASGAAEGQGLEQFATNYALPSSVAFARVRRRSELPAKEFCAQESALIAS